MYATILIIIKNIIPALVVTEQIPLYLVTIKNAILNNPEVGEWINGLRSFSVEMAKLKNDLQGYDIPENVSNTTIQLEYQSELNEIKELNNLGKGSEYLIYGLEKIQEGTYPHNWDSNSKNIVFNITSFINEITQSTGTQPVSTVTKVNGGDINILTPNKNLVNLASKSEERLLTLGYTTDTTPCIETKQKGFYEIHSLHPIAKKSLIIGTIAGIGYIIYKTL